MLIHTKRAGRPKGSGGQITNDLPPLSSVELEIYPFLPRLDLYRKLRELKTGPFTSRDLTQLIGRYVTADEREAYLAELQDMGLITYRRHRRGRHSYMHVTVRSLSDLKPDIQREFATISTNPFATVRSHFCQRYIEVIGHRYNFTARDGKHLKTLLERTGANPNRLLDYVDFFFGTGWFGETASFVRFYNAFEEIVGEYAKWRAEQHEQKAIMAREEAQEKRLAAIKNETPEERQRRLDKTKAEMIRDFNRARGGK